MDLAWMTSLWAYVYLDYIRATIQQSEGDYKGPDPTLESLRFLAPRSGRIFQPVLQPLHRPFHRRPADQWIDHSPEQKGHP